MAKLTVKSSEIRLITISDGRQLLQHVIACEWNEESFKPSVSQRSAYRFVPSDKPLLPWLGVQKPF
jgi:hypothetical protein